MPNLKYKFNKEKHKAIEQGIILKQLKHNQNGKN